MSKDDWSAIFLTLTVVLAGLGLVAYIQTEKALEKQNSQLEK